MNTVFTLWGRETGEGDAASPIILDPRRVTICRLDWLNLPPSSPPIAIMCSAVTGSLASHSALSPSSYAMNRGTEACG